MEHAYFKLLHVLSGHPAWALTVVLLAAFFESIAFIGTFVPGSTAMFVAGALVGTGSLNLGWVFACAIAGAVAGDAASYGFGSSHKETIAKLWPFRTHPGMLTAGQRVVKTYTSTNVGCATRSSQAPALPGGPAYLKEENPLASLPMWPPR